MKKTIIKVVPLRAVPTKNSDESTVSCRDGAERQIILAYRSLPGDFQVFTVDLLNEYKQMNAPTKEWPKLILVGRDKEVMHE